ncbi:MAG TPA: outer membrane beta-barrel protein [Gammaproteobacteria bacterium]|nr:outer membrane beta-barrel protein [Gammaproteobacteria bacterium]
MDKDMVSNFSKCLLIFVVLSNMPAAYCHGWYIGIGAGISTYDLPNDLESTLNDLDQATSDLNDLGVDASFDADDSDTAAKIFGGFNINPYFGIEFGYIDLGETTADFSLDSDGNLFPSGETRVGSSFSVDGFNAGVVGSLPFSDLISLNGRAGVYFWNSKSEFSARDTTGAFFNDSFSESDNGNDIYYGVGLDIGWFGLFYEIYDIDGDDINLAGISAKFSFE